MISEVGLIIAMAVAFGLVGGYCFVYLEQRVVPRGSGRRFWHSLPERLQGLLASADSTDFLKHYKALLVSIAVYCSRSALGLILGLIPMAGAFLVLVACDPSGRIANEADVYPAVAIDGSRLDTSIWSMQQGRLLVDLDKIDASGIAILGEPFDRTTFEDKHAFCATLFKCVLFDMMLFETHDFEIAEGVPAIAIVRPVLYDSNLFWPYLNDLDFWFFTTAMCGAVIAVVVRRRRGGVVE